jgi:light-regulated signal transduction histidine kinase (bacteriophytochrome)
MYKMLQKEGALNDYIISVKTKSGDVRDASIAVTIHQDAGYIEGSIVDVTEKYRAAESVLKSEQALRELSDEIKKANADLEEKSAELLRSNHELEQFAYVASHDLQEPLRMISSYTQLLAQRYEDRLDQDAKDFIGYAVDGANRMQRLIQDLLSYSRVTTRGQELSPVDMHQALGEAVINLQATVQETKALVTNDELPRVLADNTQLVQLLQNLIGNGIKFRKKDEIPCIHIGVKNSLERPGYSIFSVTDNGIGIDPKYFERLFVIFQRLHGRQEYPGTGIGLALCKRIVARHGGKIWLESEPGKGTTVYFTLKVVEIT